jgi:hypothetical protein
MSKNPADYELIPDRDLADDDDFPGEDEILDDIASALQDFEEYSTGARALKVTIVTTNEPAVRFHSTVNSDAVVGPTYAFDGVSAIDNEPVSIAVAPSGLRLQYTGRLPSRRLPSAAA